jgi:hypothetical protein
MKLAALPLALALGAALLSPAARAASLTKGTLELETSVDLTHSAFTSSPVNSTTYFSGSVGAAYSVTSLLQVGGAVDLAHFGQESDSLGSFSDNAYGASADLTANFPTPNNLIPFVRAGVGFETFSGDTYARTTTSVIAPYVRAGVRVLVGNSASVNLSLTYRHETNADGNKGEGANVVGLSAGLSIFPIRGK